ncbi:putative 5-methylcytosine g t mismatch-specific dna glycosylase [Golovinomyces cichoracearum]|uniref:Putative 5-methylcytosine g t mismatch-specific dna glycosylase n=1 Tax=Golovinomyces cichoracearum TaxID=62708 RepID=A0A420ITM3_9PEZI|nr:putative 5-methylcytosine g t mismatch-specific dna glycosylase [Golovinomyces cichoracearum]
MTHKNHQNEAHSKSNEKRHRSKSEKDIEKPNKSKSSTSKAVDADSGLYARLRKMTKEKSDNEKVRKRVSEPTLTMAEIAVPELSRTSSRNSIPYPSFNKAHSKESVGVLRNNSRLSTKEVPLTPVMTDLGSDEKLNPKSDEHIKVASNGERPPSPPETDIAQQKKPAPRRMSQVNEEIEEEVRSSSKDYHSSQLSTEDAQTELSVNSKESSSSSVERSNSDTVDDVGTIGHDSITESGDESNDTVVQDRAQSVTETSKVSSARKSSSTTSLETTTKTDDSSITNDTPTPSIFIHFDAPDKVSGIHNSSRSPYRQNTKLPADMLRVDYLLQKGGLLRHIPKKFVSSSPASAPPRSFIPLPAKVDQVFGPCISLLDQYESVLNNNGSIAVATGYRSVARRLLDRLEVVMGRNLSSSGCSCILCQHPDFAPNEKPKGLEWGEVLEWSAGRKELPLWPAFDFSALGIKSFDDISGTESSHRDPTRPSSPVKLDPDIAEEFREYYLQQSKNTRLAVDNWLSSCPQAVATPSQEVDDETLSFAILTHIPKSERPIFNALLSGSTKLQPMNLAPISLKKSRSELITKTVLSIQRLYRLPIPPRYPEAAIFLLRYPELHNILAAISEINTSEWEILTSGRFDGFLWSGADSESINSPMSSRGSTPLNESLYGRAMSPGTPQSNSASSTKSSHYNSNRRPVLNDEETEIAVLAEVEHEIYIGMEALEDAFEALHRKAELVRRALRERGVGLRASLQSRLLSQPTIVQPSSPAVAASGLGIGYERPSSYVDNFHPGDSEWDPGDELSELAPDDSASNISSSRKRRPRRRNERREPALVEEGDEE